MIRIVLAAVVVTVAVLAVPHAVTPGFNAADLIVSAAPLALVAVVLWGRPLPASADCRGGMHTACEASGGCDGCRSRCHELFAIERAAHRSLT